MSPCSRWWWSDDQMSPCSILNSESMSPPTPNTQASSSISLRISNYFLPCPWKQIFEILNFPECHTALCASCFCFCVTLCAFCFWEEGRFKITMSTPHNYLVGKIRRFSQCHTIKWRGSVTGSAPVALFISEKNNCKQNLGTGEKICRTCTDKQTRNWATSRFQNHNPYSQNPCCTDAINLLNFQQKLQPIQTYGAQISPDLQLAKIFPINLSKIAPNMWDVV